MEIQKINNISVNENGKLKVKPKIKVFYVPKDEDDIVDNIAKKNPWIGSLISENDDLKIVKEMIAKDDKLNTISSNAHHKIRKAIYDRGDKLCTLYSRCKVYTTYMPCHC